MGRRLQQVVLLLVVACCCCQATCRHNPIRQPQQDTRVVQTMSQKMMLSSSQRLTADDDCSTAREKAKCLALPGCTYCTNKFSPMPGSDGVCLSAEQAKLLPATGYKCQSSTPQQQQQQQRVEAMTASEHAAAAGKQPSNDDNCGKLREKKKCLKRSDACVWCQNKYSPFPGSNGVCTSPDQAKYLPDSTYKCSKIDEHQHAPTAVATVLSPPAAAAAGGEKPDHPGKNCSTFHVKKQCAKHSECIWCQNMFSPMPGSDGVCIEPEYKKELPKWTYKCSDDGQESKQNLPAVAVAVA